MNQKLHSPAAATPRSWWPGIPQHCPPAKGGAAVTSRRRSIRVQSFAIEDKRPMGQVWPHLVGCAILGSRLKTNVHHWVGGSSLARYPVEVSEEQARRRKSLETASIPEVLLQGIGEGNEWGPSGLTCTSLHVQSLLSCGSQAARPRRTARRAAQSPVPASWKRQCRHDVLAKTEKFLPNADAALEVQFMPGLVKEVPDMRWVLVFASFGVSNGVLGDGFPSSQISKLELGQVAGLQWFALPATAPRMLARSASCEELVVTSQSAHE